MIVLVGIAYVVGGLLCATWALQACWSESRLGRRMLYAGVLTVSVRLSSHVAAVMLTGVLR